jgi:branched-chain amino acid transport system substrate-binding protein
LRFFQNATRSQKSTQPCSQAGAGEASHGNAKAIANGGTALMSLRITSAALAFAASAALAAVPAYAQDTIKIPGIFELSGAGAISGTNFKDGLALAVEDINASGGVLGKKLVLELVDTGSDPGKARAAVQRALDGNPPVIFGPIYSGSALASLPLTDEAKVPQIVGAEAANITAQGSKYIFRTSFGQNVSMPKIANYLRDGLKVKSIAIVYVNNDFGKGGRNSIRAELESRGIKPAIEISVESGQADFAADVVKLKGANADAAFVYVNEEESARFLIEARKQGYHKPLIGETTLLGQKVVDLAKDAANGVRGHVGLTIDAPSPLVKEFARKFEAKYKYKCDHNGMKGYIGGYLFKTAAEKAGKFDPVAIAAAMHGISITVDKVPGILIDASWDAVGEIDRISYLAEIKNAKQVITATLPKLHP